VGSVFPGASLVTTAVKTGVTYLDERYRKAFLSKIRVFGSTITDVEKLGERVSRLMVRAYYHSTPQVSLTKDQADKDAKEFIRIIVESNPALVRDDSTAEVLVKAIWKNGVVLNMDPLPAVIVSDTASVVSESKSVVGLPLPPSSSSSSSFSTTVNTTVNSVLTIPLQVSPPAAPSVEEFEALKQQLAQVQSKLENAAMKSEVTTKKELAAVTGRLDKLDKSTGSGGGLAFAQQQPTHQDGTSSQGQLHTDVILGQTQSQVGLLTDETIRLREENEEMRREMAEMKRLLLAKSK